MTGSYVPAQSSFATGFAFPRTGFKREQMARQTNGLEFQALLADSPSTHLIAKSEFLGTNQRAASPVGTVRSALRSGLADDDAVDQSVKQRLESFRAFRKLVQAKDVHSVSI